MSGDWLKTFYMALAEQLKARWPKAIVYTTKIYDEHCIEITLDLQQYQIVFDGDLKIVRYHKKGDTTKPPTERVYRDVLKSYDMCDPNADFEPLFRDLDLALTESLDDC